MGINRSVERKGRVVEKQLQYILTENDVPPKLPNYSSIWVEFPDCECCGTKRSQPIFITQKIPHDVGKMLYFKDGNWQMETDPQRASRIEKEKKEYIKIYYR